MGNLPKAMEENENDFAELIDTRIPVKLPGPMVVAKISISEIFQFN